MTIYEELIQRVENGETFYIDFKNRALKVGKGFVIKNDVYDRSRELIPYPHKDLATILGTIEALYGNYKYSLPSERSDAKRRTYFKALSIDELTDMQMLTGERREVAQARLESFILFMLLDGRFQWDENTLGKWFYQSKTHPDLVILRSWIENKNN